jgi:predicted permease
MHMIEIISRFLPIFLILLLGFFLKRKKIINNAIINGLKNIIVNAALPSILFISFLTMEIENSAILLFIGTFIFCLLLYGTGILFQKTKVCNYPLSPFFFTGFEFGMVGVALFTSIFGTAQLFNILLIGLGHEFFIWFFYAPLLEAKNHGKIDPAGIVKSFFKSPIIIAILSAMFLNLTGIYNNISSNFIIEGVMTTLTMLSGLVTPLILLTVGANLQFRHISWKSAVHLISLRLIAVAALGTLLYMFTGRYVMDISKIMTYAFIIFFLLPPPFIIPVFLGPDYKKESEFYNGLLVVYTVVTLILFLIITVIMGI